MKAFKAFYRHNQFIDLETKKPIFFVQGAEFTITANEKDFKLEDFKSKVSPPLDSKDKAEWALKKFGEGDCVKILDRGEKLFFRVGNSKREVGDDKMEYIFVCSLLEDLYLYKTFKQKGDNFIWRLAKCKCMLENCLVGDFTLHEKISAKSLNELFDLTVSRYFTNQRSGATNVFDNFYRYRPGMQITFELLRSAKHLYESLESHRKRIDDSFRKKKNDELLRRKM